MPVKKAHNIYASTPFKFVVGGEPIFIHAELVSELSDPLKALISNGMKESCEGKAVLKNVDNATFYRFAQWAYNGYYTPAEHRTVVDATGESGEPQGGKDEGASPASSGIKDTETAAPGPGPWAEEPPHDDFPAPASEPFEVMAQPDDPPASVYDGFRGGTSQGFGWGSLPSKKKSEKGTKYTKQKYAKTKYAEPEYAEPEYAEPEILESLRERRKSLRDRFKNRHYRVRRENSESMPPRANKDESEDYSEVFLSHARLYVFAQCYQVEKLATLALEELHAVLKIYTLFPGRTNDIIELLPYAYDNTSEPVEGAESLRTLLADYIAFEMDTLIEDKNFGSMMIEEGGELLADFLKTVKKRIAE